MLFHDDPEKFITRAFVKIGYFSAEADLAYHDTLHCDIFTLAACKDEGTPKPRLTFDGTGIALEFRYPPEYLKAMADPGRATRQVT